MDMSADRGQANIAEVGDYNHPEIDHNYPTPMPHFAPCEGYIWKQREQRDMRGVLLRQLALDLT